MKHCNMIVDTITKVPLKFGDIEKLCVETLCADYRSKKILKLSYCLNVKLNRAYVHALIKVQSQQIVNRL